MRKILIARPRLDCSFKPGPVPDVPGAPLNRILFEFGRFIDQIRSYHEACGDQVEVDERPLWQFTVEEMQRRSPMVDRLYFPHKLRDQFPIGANAYYYKNAPLPGFMTIDRLGWGASLSFLPLQVRPSVAADRRYEILRDRIRRNISIFEQPPMSAPPMSAPYDLFLCQLPHDETIQFHSEVGVAEALKAVVEFCESRRRSLVVKGHPANPKSMQPLREITEAAQGAIWVDHLSIHDCIASAECVFTVNSGSGMEVLLHDRPLVRFGRAEYDSVVSRASATGQSISETSARSSTTRERAAFIDAYLARCVEVDDLESFERVLS